MHLAQIESHQYSKRCNQNQGLRAASLQQTRHSRLSIEDSVWPSQVPNRSNTIGCKASVAAHKTLGYGTSRRKEGNAERWGYWRHPRRRRGKKSFSQGYRIDESKQDAIWLSFLTPSLAIIWRQMANLVTWLGLSAPDFGPVIPGLEEWAYFNHRKHFPFISYNSRANFCHKFYWKTE